MPATLRARLKLCQAIMQVAAGLRELDTPSEAHSRVQTAPKVPSPTTHPRPLESSEIEPGMTSEMMVDRGSNYLFGRGGLPQNDAEAARWFSKAAERQNDRAKTNLGLPYQTGRGVPLSPDESRGGFTKLPLKAEMPRPKQISDSCPLMEMVFRRTTTRR